MTLKEHLGKNMILAYPVVIGQLGHIMVSVADSMMVGRVGVLPLAGATFAGAIYTVLMLFGIGVSYSITPLVAAENSNNKDRLRSFLQDGFLMNLILGILLALTGFIVSFFLQYFGQEHEVVAQAKPYLQVMSLSLIPLMIFQTFRQFAEGLSDTMNPMIVSIIANLLNVGLNYILIFGGMGIEAMGLFGAGVATLISRILMPLIMILIAGSMLKGFEWKFQLSGIKRMLKIGVPSGMQYVFEVGAFGGAGIMIGWIGAKELAAHNIALNLSAISYMAATGIAAASTIRIGNQLGLKDKENLRMAGITNFVLVAVFMAFCASVFIVFREFFPTLYVSEQPVIAIASTLLIVGAAFQISDGLQAVGLGVLRGLRDVKVPTIVTFISYWVIALPLGYVLAFSFDLGVYGVWIALSVGLTLAAILNIWRFFSLTNKMKFE
ncbi:MAG: MATE family efflux transporter [Ekhidna sp.]